MSEPQSAILNALAQAGLAEQFGPARTVPAMRDMLRRMIPVLEGDPPPVDRVEDAALEGPGGDLPVRVYAPYESGARGPALLYFHGGGYVLGSLDSHDVVCRRLAAASGVRVAAVEYRLAPEHRFPAAVDDALAAFDQARAGGLDRFGVDPERLAVGGDSAGGGLAAVIAQSRRGAVAFQLLIYPLLQLVQIRKPRQRWQEGPLLSTEMLAQIRETYLNEAGEASDVRVSPLLAPDLRGVAPAFILAAELDPLFDEGAAYADKLAAFGVEVERRVFKGVPHGFLNMSRVAPVAVKAAETAARALATAVGR